ncbi:MAG: hypothetical protein AAF658_10335, partial [Myxococcota bacterium]
MENGVSPDEFTTAFNKTFSGDLYPEAGALQKGVTEELERVVAALAANPAATVKFEVHDHSDGGRVQAQMRTVRLGSELRAFLVERGIDEARVSLKAMGANAPLMPGASRIARTQNRRVIVMVLAPPEVESEKPATPSTVARRVRVAGQELDLTETGEFSSTVQMESDAPLAVELVDTDGRRWVGSIPLRDGKPASRAPSPVRSGPPDGERLGTGPESLAPPREEVPPPRETNDLQPVLRLSKVSSARAPTAVRVQSTWNLLPSPQHLAQLDADSDAGTATPDPDAGTRPETPKSDAGTGPDTPKPDAGTGPDTPKPDAGTGPDTPKPDAGTGWDTPKPDAGTEAPTGVSTDVDGDVAGVDDEGPAVVTGPRVVPEGPLVVWMPPDGAELAGERLTVMGRSQPDLAVTVNGKAVVPDRHGEFALTLELPAGPAEVTVRGEREGEVFETTRTYTVPAYELFLLAMADTAFGVGDGIVGMNADTRREFDNEVYVHGRAVAYLKGRVKGSTLLASSPFEDYRVTAHVDTGKEDEPELLRQLIDPDRFYPVYGDAAEEVQDVRSREKIYVLLEADRSKFQVGNFRAQLTGMQLFQYQRSFFGASLDVDHEFVDGARTQVKAFAADGGSGTRHRQLVFQGTGGAMYFLRDDAVIEGSERVQLVIRDAVSGARLQVIPQTRDIDYTMQYRDGRLMFMQPVPSTVSAAWTINQNPVRTLDGHRVFLEIEY